MKIVELKPVPKNKVGIVIRNGIKLQPHEDSTIDFLILFGFTIDIIRPVNTPHSDNPDFLIGGTIWEAKSPEGNGKSTIERHVHKAGHQASNLVLDLRRIKLPAAEAHKEALKRFTDSKRIKHMMLITKTKKLFDIRK